jgi:hypothetical protein
MLISRASTKYALLEVDPKIVCMFPVTTAGPGAARLLVFGLAFVRTSASSPKSACMCQRMYIYICIYIYIHISCQMPLDCLILSGPSN